MAEPPRRRLRAARRSGLTGPNRSGPPTVATATRTPPPTPGTRTSRKRRATGRPHPDPPRKLLKQESGQPDTVAVLDGTGPGLANWPAIRAILTTGTLAPCVSTSAPLQQRMQLGADRVGGRALECLRAVTALQHERLSPRHRGQAFAQQLTLIRQDQRAGTPPAHRSPRSADHDQATQAADPQKGHARPMTPTPRRPSPLRSYHGLPRARRLKYESSPRRACGCVDSDLSGGSDLGRLKGVQIRAQGRHDLRRKVTAGLARRAPDRRGCRRVRRRRRQPARLRPRPARQIIFRQ